MTWFEWDEEPEDRSERFADHVIHIGAVIIIMAIIGIIILEGVRTWG